MASQPIDLITSDPVPEKHVKSSLGPVENTKSQLPSPDNGLYSIFSKNEKIGIIIIASWAAFFSPVSSNIYFPALNDLADDLHVTDSLINLTITSYMVCTKRILSVQMMRTDWECRYFKRWHLCSLQLYQMRQGGDLRT
jgi:hypothetical protein